MLNRQSAMCGNGRQSLRLYTRILILAVAVIFTYKLLQEDSALTVPWYAPDGPPPPFNDQEAPTLPPRPPSTAHLDCGRVFRNDIPYIKNLALKRVVHTDEDTDAEQLAMDCDSIRARNTFNGDMLSPESIQSRDFPVAYARIVYRHYRFLEMELAASYTPHNHFCYMIDSKAPASFQQRIRQLARCFPRNVFVTHKQFSVKRQGVNQDASFLECMQELLAGGRPWKYVFLLQNYDVQMRTNEEMVQVLKWLNGTNDVEVSVVPKARVPTKGIGSDLQFSSLKLFRNGAFILHDISGSLSPLESLNSNRFAANGGEPKLVLAKGYVECALSRAMAEWMVYDLNLEPLLNLIKLNKEFGREMLVPTLHATDALQAPGGFTHTCLDRGVRVQHVTRYTHWYDVRNCGSGHMRNSICIFGMEDLSKLAALPHLFANKFMSDFDFGAIVCWREHLYNRTRRGSSNVGLDENFYRSLPHVRFNELKRRGSVNISAFDCEFKGSNDN